MRFTYIHTFIPHFLFQIFNRNSSYQSTNNGDFILKKFVYAAVFSAKIRIFFIAANYNTVKNNIIPLKFDVFLFHPSIKTICNKLCISSSESQSCASHYTTTYTFAHPSRNCAPKSIGRSAKIWPTVHWNFNTTSGGKGCVDKTQQCKYRYNQKCM